MLLTRSLSCLAGQQPCQPDRHVSPIEREMEGFAETSHFPSSIVQESFRIQACWAACRVVLLSSTGFLLQGLPRSASHLHFKHTHPPLLPSSLLPQFKRAMSTCTDQKVSDTGKGVLEGGRKTPCLAQDTRWALCAAPAPPIPFGVTWERDSN